MPKKDPNDPLSGLDDQELLDLMDEKLAEEQRYQNKFNLIYKKNRFESILNFDPDSLYIKNIIIDPFIDELRSDAFFYSLFKRTPTESLPEDIIWFNVINVSKKVNFLDSFYNRGVLLNVPVYVLPEVLIAGAANSGYLVDFFAVLSIVSPARIRSFFLQKTHTTSYLVNLGDNSTNLNNFLFTKFLYFFIFFDFYRPSAAETFFTTKSPYDVFVFSTLQS